MYVTALGKGSGSVAHQALPCYQRTVGAELPVAGASVWRGPDPSANLKMNTQIAGACQHSLGVGKSATWFDDQEIWQHVPGLLARVELRQKEPTGRDHAYMGFLNALASWGYLDDLPLDSSGALHVNVPHSGGFSEAPLLLPFLARKVLCPGRGAHGLVFHCSDLEPNKLWWATFTEWAKRTQDPRVRLEFSQVDLVSSRLQPAGLTLAVHPGPDLSPRALGPWRYILENVIRSCAPGGLCIFASFYEHEVQGVQMVCEALGVPVEVRVNPYYEADPMPYYIDSLGVKAHPLRYITIAKPRS